LNLFLPQKYQKEKENPYNYNIIWIFIAGDIDDERETEELLKSNQALSLSILIFGLGNNSFNSMKLLVKRLNLKREYVVFYPIVEYKEKILKDKIISDLCIHYRNYFNLKNLVLK